MFRRQNEIRAFETFEGYSWESFGCLLFRESKERLNVRIYSDKDSENDSGASIKALAT